MASRAAQMIVALDVGTFEEARKLFDMLKDDVDIFKVGSQLFTACGPVIVRYIQAHGKKVFLDLKYHDIPNTVASAVRAAVSLSRPAHEIGTEDQKETERYQPLFMLTIHTSGGDEMMKAAVDAATKESARLKVTPPLIVGISVLTSDKKTDNIHRIVLERARLAKACGLDGVVSSSQEASLIRQDIGDNFLIVTPGIRPPDSEAGDQKRITTPQDAVANGSDFLVVGRPVVQADNPVEAAKSILQSMRSG